MDCSIVGFFFFFSLLQAALAVWICVLRFMGDMPEPRYKAETSTPAEKEKVRMLSKL